MKKVPFGNGITARERELCETEEEKQEAADAISRGWDCIGIMECRCNLVLLHRGLPIDTREYCKREKLPVQSPEWYAVAILDKLRLAGEESGKGNTRAALCCAVDAGMLYEEIVMKFAHEPHALIGMKTEAGTETAKQKAARERIIRVDGWRDIADSVYEENPTWKITAIRDEIAERIGLSSRRQLETAGIYPRRWPRKK